MNRKMFLLCSYERLATVDKLTSYADRLECIVWLGELMQAVI